MEREKKDRVGGERKYERKSTKDGEKGKYRRKEYNRGVGSAQVTLRR